MLALIGFWGSLVFYNSYLPDIAFPDQQDSISAKGYALGYLGSVVLLIVNLAMVMTAETDADRMKMMQLSFLLVGIWWMGFSQYTYYYLPSFNNGNKIKKNIIFNGFKELNKVWHEFKRNQAAKKISYRFFCL